MSDHTEPPEPTATPEPSTPAPPPPAEAPSPDHAVNQMLGAIEAKAPSTAPEAPGEQGPSIVASAQQFVSRIPVITAALIVMVVFLAQQLLAPGLLPIRLGAARTATDIKTEDAIEKVASRFGTNLITFDYRTLERDFKRITDDSVGEFKEQFGRVDIVRPDIVKAKAQSKGSVQAVGLKSQDGGSAVAIIVLERTIENTKNPDGVNALSVLEVTLVDTPQGWKATDVKDLTAGTVGT